jgi:hypothetical protein
MMAATAWGVLVVMVARHGRLARPLAGQACRARACHVLS